MVNEPTWRVATHTGTNGNCIEVGGAARAILVRDTKDRTGGTLTFTAGAWQAFATSLK